MRRPGIVTTEGEHRYGRFAGPLFATAVILVGLTTTALIVAGVRTAQRENAAEVMDQRAEMAHAAVFTEAERYRSLIEATAAGLGTDDTITWEDFDAVTSPLASAGLIGAVNVSYVVPSTTEQVARVQRHWRELGAEGLVLRPTGFHDEHYFTIFSRPLSDTGGVRDGTDLAAVPQPARALVDARRMSRPTVSDTYVLLRDRDLPRAAQQQSFIFAAPVWPRAAEPRFRGWLVLSMRGQDFLNGVLATVSQGQLNGRLLATNADGTRPVVAEYAVPGRPDLERRSDLTIADREWTLTVRADSRRLPGGRSSLPAPSTAAAGGMLITCTLAWLVYVLATGRSRARARVLEATAELSDAEAESRRQASLLGAVMASIADGVGVADENGNLLMHNPAARHLLGMGDPGSGPQDWPRHYGLFLPDGRTLYPVEDLPLLRALRGECPNGVEMVVRNPARPEGILISVDARPLDPSGGQRGAVAVFRDITDLRRYETDLAVFAGVVAHDLTAPLSVVRGHCEAAAEALNDLSRGGMVAQAATAEAKRALVRIDRAVERMAGMIDTLLAYTTARDAPLSTRPVGLGRLTTEVVHDRIAHLRPADRPEVHIGPLPVVRADPAMLRHVLDNLVGNALKYVRPGSTARLEVSAVPAPAGRTRIEIADRGIGIPDADKAAIFERFHRAHAAAGYGGTGLGLAICKRIVERHGGQIGVADNPGGGTRFHFTLPLAQDAETGTVVTSTDDPRDDEAAARARLERALAERAAIQDAGLPGMAARPGTGLPGTGLPGTGPPAPVADRDPSGPGA